MRVQPRIKPLETALTCHTLKMAIDYVLKHQPIANVAMRNNNHGGYMKDEVLAQFAKDQQAAVEKVYDGGYSDGAAGKEGLVYSQADMDAAKATSFQEGVDSVHIPETPVGEGQPGFSQEQVDKMIAEAIAALPADTTPYSEEEMGAVKSELVAVKAELDKVKSDDEADKAAIALGQAKIQAAIEALTK